MYPPVSPILIELGPLTLRWYGILMAAAILVGTTLAARYVSRRGEAAENVWDLLFWALIPGLIGARLYYVFIQSPRGPQGLGRYLSNPVEIIQIWSGGLHIFGGFILGGLAVWLFLRFRKLPPLIYLDGIALGLPLAQAIGRLANFINQELYGPPTTLPWGLRIDPQHRIPPFNDLETYPDSTRFQPLFLYESLWNLLGFIVISQIARRQPQPGTLVLCYLVWYPLGRFMLEFWRTDSWFFPGTPFNVVHILSAGAVFAASLTLFQTRPKS